MQNMIQWQNLQLNLVGESNCHLLNFLKRLTIWRSGPYVVVCTYTTAEQQKSNESTMVAVVVVVALLILCGVDQRIDSLGLQRTVTCTAVT